MEKSRALSTLWYSHVYVKSLKSTSGQRARAWESGICRGQDVLFDRQATWRHTIASGRSEPSAMGTCSEGWSRTSLLVRNL